MFRRIQQFIRAVTATVDANDGRFLAKHLTVAEQGLFQQMTVPDQRHALNVAYTAQQLAKKFPGLRLRLLMRAALLHDVGRTQFNLSTVDKVFAVLFSVAFPKFSQRWAKPKTPRHNFSTVARFQHVLFVYYHHGKIGARRLQNLGVETELIEMVAKHHQTIADNDAIEMALLHQADQLN